MLGTSVIKDVVAALDKIGLESKSSTNQTTSLLTVSQQLCKKLNENPGLLEPSQLYTVSLTSSFENETSRCMISSTESLPISTPLKIGLMLTSSLKLASEKFRTSFLTSSIFSFLPSSVLTKTIKVLLNLALITLWKKIEFLSPSFNHKTLDFCLNKLSFKYYHF